MEAPALVTRFMYRLSFIIMSVSGYDDVFIILEMIRSDRTKCSHFIIASFASAIASSASNDSAFVILETRLS